MTAAVAAGDLSLAWPPGHQQGWSRFALARPATASFVPCARRCTRRVLRSWHLSNLAGDGEMVVAELVTNAVQATELCAAGAEKLALPVTLGLRSDGTRLVVEVTDGALGRPRTGGRGLAIVSALAEAWGWYPATGGKLVWALL
jgi:hypothetical protein